MESQESQAQVTIVVVPRERFSAARESLESVFQHADIPFELVYVDAGSPTPVQRYLEAQARIRHFRLVRIDHYLTPNRARNVGLGLVKTPYVVFMDNDVVVAPRWLEPLVACMRATGAAIVSPLICGGLPLHEVVHCAGGESGIRVDRVGDRLERHIIEKIHLQGARVDDVRGELDRRKTGLAEFHCMMVRTETLERIGRLDEHLLNTKEHVDLCLTVTEAGGSIYFEPASVVTYVPVPLTWRDVPFYMLRWSDAWEAASLRRLGDKWRLTEDQYFKNRSERLGWRRRNYMVKPISRRLAFGRRFSWLENALVRLEKVLNRRLAERYARGSRARRDDAIASTGHHR